MALKYQSDNYLSMDPPSCMGANIYIKILFWESYQPSISSLGHWALVTGSGIAALALAEQAKVSYFTTLCKRIHSILPKPKKSAS